MKKRILFTLFLTMITLFLFAQVRVEGHLIVRLQDNVRSLAMEGFTASYDTAEMRHERVLSDRHNIHLFKFNETTMRGEDILDDVRANPNVYLAQFDFHLERRSEFIPNDTRFGDMWGMKNTGQNGGTPGEDIKATYAWHHVYGPDNNSNTRDVVVAVLDDGFAMSHPDLRFHALRWCTITNSTAIASANHGTHVAGTVGARGNNDQGVIGVAWDDNFYVMPIRMSLAISTMSSYAIAAYNWVMERRIEYNISGGTEGAFVVATNSSWGRDGTQDQFPVWANMYNLMGEVGILSAAATTNSNTNIDVVGDAPTSFDSPYLISVTRTTRVGARIGGFGATTIDLGAPGQDILSTTQPSGYGNNSGTSMATPHVAGAIGLMYRAASDALLNYWSNDPAGLASLMKEKLLDGVDPLPSLAGTTVTGGRLNVLNAVLSVIEMNQSVPPANVDLIYPLDNAILVPITPTFHWEESSAWGMPTYYILEISMGYAFTNIVYTSEHIVHPNTTYIIPAEAALENHTDYYWRVIAYNHVGSAPSPHPLKQFTTIHTIPCHVTLIYPINNAVNVPTLPTFTWQASTDSQPVDYYRLEVSGNGSFTSMIYTSESLSDTTTTHTLPENNELVNGFTYFWRVIAINDIGESVNNTIFSFIVEVLPPGNVTLLAPLNNATDVSLTPIFKWQEPSSGGMPAIYQVQISENIDFDPYVINQAINYPMAEFILPAEMALAFDNTYFWRVITSNTGGTAPAPYQTWQFTTINRVPYPVVLLTPINHATEIVVEPTFTWEESTCIITGYYLYLSTSSNPFNPEEPETNRIVISKEYTSWTATTVLEYETVYYWTVVAYNTVGIGGVNSPWMFTTEEKVSVDDIDALPLVTGLIGNYPNPFNPETTISFAIETPLMVSVLITVYDIRGRLVRTLLDGSREFGFGRHSVVWDGRDDHSNQVSSGIYFYRMRAGEYIEVRRMVLMK
jgi:hypothetical protein